MQMTYYDAYKVLPNSISDMSNYSKIIIKTILQCLRRF